MNSQSIKASTSTGVIWFVPIVKIRARKKSVEVRQLFLISRIMISIFTIGLMGYMLDRVMRLLHRSSLLN